MALTRFRMAAAGIWSRTAARARKTDWAAVAGELLIVVLGILIAFQLDRWAEHWRRNQERQLYFERLAEESRGNATALEERQGEFIEDTAQVLGLARAIADPAQRTRIAARPNYACGALRLPGARLQTAALEEAGDAGALELLPDAQLRQLLHAAAATDRFANLQLDYFRDTFQRFGEHIDPHTIWRVDTVSGNFSCHIALDALAADREAVSLLGRIYRDRVRYAEIRAEQIAAHRALAARAQCLFDGSC
ncbi:MAG: hypothetical protein E6G92_12325 [Alphaproteobacteria bacterium]|nr:MAG: hypothetical protein E6G92_12325 [Alphaproteobacteria bacterium]